MKVKGQLLLGVNIDHVATLREVRKSTYPDPVVAALDAQRAGADGITLHIREDRRHVQERDLRLMTELLEIPLNLECALTDEMIEIALRYKPAFCCLVPERREELTTEGGLDVKLHFDRIQMVTKALKGNGMDVSLFIDPCHAQIEAAFETGAQTVELHTGAYAEAKGQALVDELNKIRVAAQWADKLGLKVNAGHGLHLRNVVEIAKCPEIIELNIGHSLVADAMWCGFYEAVKAMKTLMQSIRS